MGLVKNYPQLVGARVCLGIAEAGLCAYEFRHYCLANTELDSRVWYTST